MTSLREKLADKAYRDRFVSAHIGTGLSFQIIALREQRGWSQRDLGERVGIPQSGVSRLEAPGHGFSIATLKKLAAAFDVALAIRFVPFSDLAGWVGSLRPGSLEVASFDADTGFHGGTEATTTETVFFMDSSAYEPASRPVETPTVVRKRSKGRRLEMTPKHVYTAA